MKPLYQKLIGCPDEGVVVKEIRGTACNCPWHCHPEIELVWVLRGHGYRIVGDNIRTLRPGDLVLLGPNLPHAYQHDANLPARSRVAHCILLQFEERALSSVLGLPAAASVRRLLHKAQQGLHVVSPAKARAAVLLTTMLKRRGLLRVSLLLELLDLLARSRSCRTISSPGFTMETPSRQQERIGKICRFVDENCHRPLPIGEVARLVHMSPGAFSRFFRSHLGKTFPSFVNDLRIGRACRLLLETDTPMTEIALSCGYPNLSNFNRQFLHRKKVSPRVFRQHMQGSAGA